MAFDCREAMFETCPGIAVIVCEGKANIWYSNYILFPFSVSAEIGEYIVDLFNILCKYIL